MEQHAKACGQELEDWRQGAVCKGEHGEDARSVGGEVVELGQAMVENNGLRWRLGSRDVVEETL